MGGNFDGLLSRPISYFVSLSFIPKAKTTLYLVPYLEFLPLFLPWSYLHLSQRRWLISTFIRSVILPWGATGNSPNRVMRTFTVKGLSWCSKVGWWYQMTKWQIFWERWMIIEDNLGNIGYWRCDSGGLVALHRIIVHLICCYRKTTYFTS